MMKTEKRLETLVERAKQLSTSPTLAVVWPADASSLAAVKRAVETHLVQAIVVGSCDIAREALGALAEVQFIEAETPAQAAATAVGLVRAGEAQLLMKGLVGTDVVLRAMLNKESGILDKGNVLTHLTIADIPSYNKLLCFGDVAVMPHPADEQREAQLRLVLALCRSLGVDEPRVSLIHCSEKADPRHFPYTAHYLSLVERAKGGEYGRCRVDGPLDVKTSCCIEAARTKGIASPIEGQADALLFPEIESGNAFYKAITLFAGATTACLVVGARVPAVVPSRGDNEWTKYYSIAAACCMIQTQ